MAKIDSENLYYLFNSQYGGNLSEGCDLHPHPPTAPNFIRRKMLTNNGEFNLLCGFAKITRQHRIDVFHTNYFKPLLISSRSVIVIHDILQEIMPQYFSPKLQFIQKTLLPLMARQADAVITVSHFTKTQLLEKYRLNPNKIFVTLEAAANVFRRLELDPSEVLQRYGIEGEYILYVGRLAPIKNIPTMLKAYAKVHRHLGGDLKFVLVGQRDPAFPESEIDGLIDYLEISDSIIFLSSVPTEDMVAIYNLASVFLFMSYGEGFGLPILEAMACGAPVITSDTTACNEIAGNAAIKLPPGNVDQIADAIIMVLKNSGLQKELSEKGLARSDEFKWESCARETLNVFEHVLRR